MLLLLLLLMLLLLVLLGGVAVAVAVAGLILFRYLSIRPHKGLIRPYKAPYDVLVVALLDPRHPGPYIPPFLLENIIPGEAVFSPLSFFWRGIIWTPEMWG